MQKDNPQDSTQNTDNQYSGNIWGWKFSFISLGIIVAMLLLMLYRYSVVKTYPPASDKQTISIEDDSSNLESQSVD